MDEKEIDIWKLFKEAVKRWRKESDRVRKELYEELGGLYPNAFLDIGIRLPSGQFVELDPWGVNLKTGEYFGRDMETSKHY